MRKSEETKEKKERKGEEKRGKERIKRGKEGRGWREGGDIHIQKCFILKIIIFYFYFSFCYVIDEKCFILF